MDEAGSWDRFLETRACMEAMAFSTAPPGNDQPFLLPSTVTELRGQKLQTVSLPDEFKCFHKSLGTWDIPMDKVLDALMVRVALPMQLPQSSPYDKPPRSGEASLDRLEEEEWTRVVATKDRERGVWGCYDTAAFALPPPLPSLDCETPALLGGRRGACPVDPLSLRGELHTDDTEIDTSLEAGECAWRIVPEKVLDVVPKDVWEASAQGGFCARSEPVPVQVTVDIGVEEDWCCAVCLGEDPAGVQLLRCGHKFHRRCLSQWFRMSCRCPLCRRKVRGALPPPPANPEMDFELDGWPLLPSGVVLRDEATAEQLAAISLREHLGRATIARRREKLSSRFHAEPSARFFEEVLPLEEATGPSTAGPEAVAQKWRQAREEAAARMEQRAALGALLTRWPEDGRWPAMPVSDAATRRREVVTERLRARGRLQRPVQVSEEQQDAPSLGSAPPARSEPASETGSGSGLARLVLALVRAR